MSLYETISFAPFAKICGGVDHVHCFCRPRYHLSPSHRAPLSSTLCWPMGG